MYKKTRNNRYGLPSRYFAMCRLDGSHAQYIYLYTQTNKFMSSLHVGRNRETQLVANTDSEASFGMNNWSPVWSQLDWAGKMLFRVAYSSCAQLQLN